MGAYFSNDPSKPEPNGSFLARSSLSWNGTIQVVVQIAFAVTTMQLVDNSIGADHRYLLSGMLVTSALFALGSLGFNIFYWGATAATRAYMTLVNGRPATETTVERSKYVDRIARAHGDQLLSTWILASSSVVLIWLTKFYYNEGVHTFQPLVDGFLAKELMNYNLIKFFQLCNLGIAAVSVLIALGTSNDLFKRFALESAIGGFPMTSVVSHTESTSTLGKGVPTMLGHVRDE